MNSMTLNRLHQLREMSKEPQRTAMSRSQQFPSMAAQHIAGEQELVRLRSALSEAVEAIEAMQRIFTGDQRDRLKLALEAATAAAIIMPVQRAMPGVRGYVPDMVVGLPVPLWEDLLVAIDYLPFPE